MIGFVHSNSLDIFYNGNNVNRIRNRPLLLNHTFSKQILLVTWSDDLEIVGLGLSSFLQIIQLNIKPLHWPSQNENSHSKCCWCYFSDTNTATLMCQSKRGIRNFKLKCSLILVLAQLILKSYGYVYRSQVPLDNSED